MEIQAVAADDSSSPSDVPAFAEPAAEEDLPVLYTPEQAAKMLQVRPSWLRRRAAARTVPCRFLGKHLRFAKQDIEEIAAAGRQSARNLPEPTRQCGEPPRHA
ncbi:helix-turn-helix domain-containing protein [Lentzea tibetensis]|uniref:helix-turn-helix domain-containing protein n=1 Tax=Lentzea tibetensis TaxID=2591470 RepID=UPI001C9945F9|nr:helix-turn-helix domain-containing protein [Lentzea tibetensis]